MTVSVLRVLGAILVASPFVAVTIFGAKQLGVWYMVMIWGLVAAIVGAIIGGTYLMAGAS